MTHPPQQPPQPYGQYPGNEQPGYYGQPSGYGQPGGYGGPPQQQSKTGLWVGLSVGAAVLVAVVVFLVTGLVAPGFLLGDEKDSEQDSASSSTSAAPSSAAPASSDVPTSAPSEGAVDAAGRAAIEEFLAKINAADKAGAMNLSCERGLSVETRVDEAIAGSAQLKVSEFQTLQSGIVYADLNDSTWKGKPAIGSAYADSRKGRPCISIFSLLEK